MCENNKNIVEYLGQFASNFICLEKNFREHKRATTVWKQQRRGGDDNVEGQSKHGTSGGHIHHQFRCNMFSPYSHAELPRLRPSASATQLPIVLSPIAVEGGRQSRPPVSEGRSGSGSRLPSPSHSKLGAPLTPISPTRASRERNREAASSERGTPARSAAQTPASAGAAPRRAARKSSPAPAGQHFEAFVHSGFIFI